MDLRIQDEFAGTHKKIMVKEGNLIGAVLFGDIKKPANDCQAFQVGIALVWCYTF